MLHRLPVLLASALALTSCMVTYQDFPPVGLQSEPLVPQERAIHYHIIREPPGVGWVYYALTYSNLERLFEQNEIFPQAIAVTSPPEKGIYCSAEVGIKTTGIVPGILVPREETQSNVVMYSLYRDGEWQQNYVYAFNRKVTWWILAAPIIMWGNLFTYSSDDPVRATFYQFLLDAERDGYFQPPSVPS